MILTEKIWLHSKPHINRLAILLRVSQRHSNQPGVFMHTSLSTVVLVARDTINLLLLSLCWSYHASGFASID